MRQPSAARTVASAFPRLRAPPVTRATRPLIPRSTLLYFELRLALGEERLNALGGVLGAERLEERPHLDREGLIDRRLDPVVDGFDDQARGHGRTPGDLTRERLRLAERLALLGEPVDQPERQTLRRRYLGAEDHELEGLGAADQPRHALRAAVPGDDAEARLRLAHPRRLLEQAEVAGHGDLATTAERVPVERGDHRLGKALDRAQDGIAEADERVDVAAAERRAEIGAGTENLVPGARDDDRADAVIGHEGDQRGREVLHELFADGVGRGPVERDDSEGFLAGEA